MASTIIETIYQAAFNDELEKIAGVPRFGITKRVLEFTGHLVDKERQKTEDKRFKKTRVFKKWSRQRKKDLSLIRKNWRKQQKTKIV